MRSLTTLALLGITSTVFSTPGEWPQWRGPNRDGLSTDTQLLKAWPPAGPALVWKTTGCGIGYSSVAVTNDRLFTMGDQKDASYIVAFDLDGKKLWATAIGKTGADYPGTRSTPTVSGDLVFGLAQFGDLICVDAATGNKKWQRNLEKEFGGRVGGWKYAESPLVDGDKVLCSPGGPKGAVVALKKDSGEEVWRSKEYKDPAEYSSIVAATIQGKRQYVHFSGNSVVGLDPDSGKLLWRVQRQGSTATVPTPIVHDDHVYVTSGYGVGCNLFHVTKEGEAFKAEEVYSDKTRKVMVNHHGGVVLVGENVYGYSDSRGLGWVCQDFKTGKVRWNDNKLGKGSIAFADGMLYLRREDGPGTVALIEATPEGWREKGRFDQPFRARENSWAHPVVSGGRLYLRDMDVLLCYDVRAK